MMRARHPTDVVKSSAENGVNLYTGFKITAAINASCSNFAHCFLILERILLIICGVSELVSSALIAVYSWYRIPNIIKTWSGHTCVS